MRSEVLEVGGPREDNVLSRKEAVEFWQREVHYYERRAGEQGVMANRIITLAIALTAVFPVAWNAISNSTGVAQLMVALGVPAIIMLLVTNAFRLVHEMERLRRYVQHSEAELIRSADGDDSLRAYRRWADIGGKKDKPVFLTLALALLTLAICSVGIFSFIDAVATDQNPWSPVIYIVAIVLVLIIVVGFFSISVHARNVAKKLISARTSN